MAKHAAHLRPLKEERQDGMVRHRLGVMLMESRSAYLIPKSNRQKKCIIVIVITHNFSGLVFLSWAPSLRSNPRSRCLTPLQRLHRSDSLCYTGCLFCINVPALFRPLAEKADVKSDVCRLVRRPDERNVPHYLPRVYLESSLSFFFSEHTREATVCIQTSQAGAIY